MGATSELSDRWRDPAFVDGAHAWIAACCSGLKNSVTFLSVIIQLLSTLERSG